MTETLTQAKKDALMAILDSLSNEEIEEALKNEDLFVSIHLAYDRDICLPYKEGMDMLRLMQLGELRVSDGYNQPEYIKPWGEEIRIKIMTRSQYVEEKMTYILFKENENIEVEEDA